MHLGPVSEVHAELLLSVWNDPAFIRNVSDRGIRTIEQAREAIQDSVLKLFDEHGYGPYWLRLKSDDSYIGICGLFKREHLEHPDIGFALLPDWVGQGYAGEAAAAVVDYAREALGLGTLTAIVSSGNEPSIGLIRKLGMSYERMVTMPGDDKAIQLYSMSL